MQNNVSMRCKTSTHSVILRGFSPHNLDSETMSLEATYGDCARTCIT